MKPDDIPQEELDRRLERFRARCEQDDKYRTSDHWIWSGSDSVKVGVSSGPVIAWYPKDYGNPRDRSLSCETTVRDSRTYVLQMAFLIPKNVRFHRWIYCDHDKIRTDTDKYWDELKAKEDCAYKFEVFLHAMEPGTYEFYLTPVLCVAGVGNPVYPADAFQVEARVYGVRLFG